MVNRFIPSRSNRRQRISVPDLLWNRQQYGFQRTNELAGRIAWNSSRMQNMILSVGPGTPASVIMSKPAASESGSSASDDDDSGEEGDNHDSDDDYVYHFWRDRRAQITCSRSRRYVLNLCLLWTYT